MSVSVTKSLVPFEAYMQQILQIAACPGLVAVENQRDMYILNLPPNRIRPSIVAPWLNTPLHICQKCYYEYCVGNMLESCFTPTRITLGDNIASNVCVAGHWVQPRIALLMAAAENDIGIFTSITLSTVMYNTSQKPPNTICNAQTGTVGPKYNFRQQTIYNFGICEYCVYTVAAIFPQLNQQLVLQARPQSHLIPSLCNFNVATTRFSNIVTELMRSYASRDISTLIRYITELSALPPCTLETHSGDMSRLWYTTATTPDLDVCAECHFTTIRGTPLAALFYVRTNRVPGISTACDLYSPRSRKAFQDACESNSMTEFMEFAHSRATIVNKILELQKQKEASGGTKDFNYFLVEGQLAPLLKEYVATWQ